MQTKKPVELYPLLYPVFKIYLKHFESKNSTFSDPIKLKIAHTLRVVREIRVLAEYCNHTCITSDIAKCTALLHDIGRFQQYASFGTYDDRISINHAALGVIIIDHFKLLSQHPDSQQRLIRKAILLHNREVIPKKLDSAERILTQLLKDADKLDIWKVTIDHDKHKPVTSNFSPENLERLYRFQKIPYTAAKTEADTRLFRLSWVFDVYFPQTIHAILSRGYIKQMFAKLPHTRQFAQLQKTIENVLHHRLES